MFGFARPAADIVSWRRNTGKAPREIDTKLACNSMAQRRPQPHDLQTNLQQISQQEHLSLWTRAAPNRVRHSGLGSVPNRRLGGDVSSLFLAVNILHLSENFPDRRLGTKSRSSDSAGGLSNFHTDDLLCCAKLRRVEPVFALCRPNM